MKYKFDEIIDRSRTNSFKWKARELKNNGHEMYPMWVADMEFDVSPIGNGNSRALLSSVLERIKPEIGRFRRVITAVIHKNAEYAAFLVEVAVIAGSRSRLIKIRARHRFTGHRDPAGAS